MGVLQKSGTFSIRNARSNDAEKLTELSFASKRYWNYPEEFLTMWRSELTITGDYIERNDVFVAETDGELSGYYSLVHHADPLILETGILPTGTWLEHMFVRPDCIGCGIGRALFSHLQRQCQRLGGGLLHILADPHARGFYEKMGCSYLREFPSSIAGRTTPWLSYTCGSGNSGLETI